MNVIAGSPRIDPKELEQMCSSESIDVYIWNPVAERFEDFCR
jgi:hypothetical protein